VRSRWVGLALLLALAACSEHSQVNPNATVHVTGSVVGADGRALANRPVRLGSGVSSGDASFAFLTFGLACTTGSCSGRVRSVSTDSRGLYDFTLKGRETQSTFGEAESELLSVGAAPSGTQVSGPSASARFMIQTSHLVLPVLRLVDPRLGLSSRPGAVAASWARMRPGPYALSFETASQVPVWRVRSVGTGTLVDARLLEDTSGRAVLAGGSRDAVVGSSVSLSWRSPGVGYAAALGAPESRGRPCVFSGTTVTSCPLTDGDLSTAAPVQLSCPRSSPPSPIPAPQCVVPTRAVVDLGASVPADLVVVRGCFGGCAVDVSTDGRRFRPVGSVSDDYGLVHLPAQRLRAVRVGLGSRGLREVSVWAPAVSTPGLRPVDAKTRERIQAPFGIHGPGRSLPTWTVVLAAALLAGCLLGLGFVLGRRRVAVR
jgi:hypothetical protein